MTAALSLDDAGLTSRDHVRLHPTSVDVATGTCVGVVGRNGSGKSSLLAVLAGEARPSTGTARLDGIDVATLPPTLLARRRAVLTQETAVSFPFRVREVVAWGRTPWRGSPEAQRDDEAIEAAMAAQGLGPLADRTVTSLSGGERKRVHLARVMAQGAPVLLLDEADADLDLVGRGRLDDVVRAHIGQGGTCVIVSHDVSRLARLCDRFLLLREGRIVSDGTVDEVITTPVLSAAFDAAVEVDRGRDGLSVHLPRTD